MEIVQKITNYLRLKFQFYNRSQSGSYNGWELTNAKPLDVSGQNILVQAYVNNSTITFEVIGILPTSYNFSLMDSDDCEVSATTGTIAGTRMIATGVGGGQALFTGSFTLQNGSNGNITIAPPINWGIGMFKDGDILYAQDISVIDNIIFLNNIKFIYSSSDSKFKATISNYTGTHIILIMPQYLERTDA